MKYAKPIDMFRPDANRLEEEWVEQSGLVWTWGKKLAKARKRVEDKKAQLELVEAELELAIRNKPSSFGLDRLREASIKKTVVIQPEYKRAKKSLSRAKFKVGLTEAYVNGLEHKKASLEALLKIEARDWWAEPRVPKELKEHMGDTRKRSTRRKAIID